MVALSTWIESHQGLLFWVGAASLALLVATLAVLPFVVAKLPEDYFTRERRQSARKHRKYPLFWAFLTLGQNALGIFLVLAGLAMLVLPGQGLLVILIGLALTNFPGKYAIERRIIRMPAIAASLNKIRKLAGRPALRLPPTREP